MKKSKPMLLVPVIGILACGEQPHDHESPMAGMTAEEHAMMQAGGMQGQVDSTGQEMRQNVHLTADQSRALGIVYATVERETLRRRIRTVALVEAAEPNIADVTPKIEGFVEELFVATTGEQVRQGQSLLPPLSLALLLLGPPDQDRARSTNPQLGYYRNDVRRGNRVARTWASGSNSGYRQKRIQSL